MPASPVVVAEMICSWLEKQDTGFDECHLDDVADFAVKLLGHTPLRAGRVRALTVAPGLAASDLDLPWAEAEACRAAWLRERDGGGGDAGLPAERREARALDRLGDTLVDPERVDDLLRLVAGIGLTRTRWTPARSPAGALVCVHAAFCSDRHPAGVVGALPVEGVRAGDAAMA